MASYTLENVSFILNVSGSVVMPSFDIPIYGNHEQADAKAAELVTHLSKAGFYAFFLFESVNGAAVCRQTYRAEEVKPIVIRGKKWEG